MTNQEKKCCTKCGTGDPNPKWSCDNSACSSHQAPIPEKEEILSKQAIREMLGNKAHIDYERNQSHYHCWHQSQPPACGIPLDKHTQCCLCGMQYARGAGVE